MYHLEVTDVVIKSETLGILTYVLPTVQQSLGDELLSIPDLWTV